MILYPKFYCDKVTDVGLDLLKKNEIKGIILDVDNTLIDIDRNLLEGVTEWTEKLKENGIKLIIASNSNKVEKVEAVANILGISYIYFSTKPLKRGLRKAQKQLELDSQNIAVIGDQIFTDVLGANRCKMFSILVNPISKKDLFLTKIKRPLEEIVVKNYVKKLEAEQKKKEE